MKEVFRDRWEDVKGIESTSTFSRLPEIPYAQAPSWLISCYFGL
jgi:hypothetical protein